MKLIEKIAKAKAEIKNSSLKKEGWNDYSKYAYFTPSQIEFLVGQICDSNKLLTKFDLIRNDLGVFGKLTIFDCDSIEKLEYEMATAIPEIKATNIAQQLGGCVTYTERYLKTSAFGITDNQLDFDSHEPKKEEKPNNTKPEKTSPEKPFINEEQLQSVIDRILKGEQGLVEKTCNVFRVTKESREKLDNAVTVFNSVKK